MSPRLTLRKSRTWKRDAGASCSVTSSLVSMLHSRSRSAVALIVRLAAARDAASAAAFRRACSASSMHHGGRHAQLKQLTGHRSRMKVPGGISGAFVDMSKLQSVAAIAVLQS